MDFSFENASFNLQILDYLVSQYQGKHAFLSILSTLNSAHFKSGDLVFVNNDLTKTDQMRKELLTNKKLYINKSGNNENNSDARILKSSLQQTSMDLLNCAEKIEPVINSTDYSSDAEKVNLLVATYGRCCYQRLHQLIFNLDSAEKLGLTNNLPQIQKARQEAQATVQSLDQFIQNTMLSKKLISQEVYITFWETAATTDVYLKSFCHDIDQFLIFSEKDTFEYTDYPYIDPQEIETWKTLNVAPVTIGYWKAADFTANKARPWIEANIPDPLFCNLCLKYKISISDAKLCLETQLPLPFARRWLALGVDLKTGIERMKNGETPALVKEGERML